MDLIKKVAKSGWVGPILDKIPLLNRKKLNDIYNNWKITKHEKEVIREAKKKDLSVLISGFAKSGNTWARFVVFNYLYVRDNKIKNTISYDHLNEVQSTVLSRETDVEGGYSDDIFFARTHRPYYRPYDYFDVVVYIYRNPLDTLVSSYHSASAKGNIEKNISIDKYVKKRIKKWVNHYKKTFGRSDIHLSYKKRKEDPYHEFGKLIERIDPNYNDEDLKRAIELSSFSSIKTMSENKGQEYGNYPNHEEEISNDFNFTRSGKVGQYKNKLNEETIRWCKEFVREKM
ncbi:hypothetical protein GGQ04_002675 [Salinibacter ruber]|uniref:sulfotransferase domain-containing protein n=1 Tax=Salinibacter ruber TaxID=146919 RepID=UPI002168AEAF|nr:sulfotransferase domain-containing protein [Salinibacter ruber]MCS4047527.1 hypothetical protein [Salinibacter ruber]